MMREIKRPEIRKNEILNTARRFFFQKGFKQTSIQDIIDDLGIAKGTFYHYFKSKVNLLDELIECMTSEMAAQLRSIMNSEKSAIKKFNEIFIKGTSFKAANLELFLILLKVLYKDENTIIREKLFRSATEKYRSIFSAIVNQGIREGVFNTPHPDDIIEMVMQLGRSLNETICRLLLEQKTPAKKLIEITKVKTELYQDAIERILGAPKGSIKVYIPEDFKKIVMLFYKNLRKEDV